MVGGGGGSDMGEVLEHTVLHLLKKSVRSKGQRWFMKLSNRCALKEGTCSPYRNAHTHSHADAVTSLIRTETYAVYNFGP